MTADATPTDWSRYDVPAVATMLSDDYDHVWDQVLAWYTAHESICEHQAQLAKARAELAEAWPPERSPAAATYLQQVDDLHASMVATAEIAMTNATAFANVIDALAAAQSAIAELHQEWLVHVSNDVDSQPSSRHSPADTTSASWSARLNAQAQRTMASTDQEIFENTRRLQAPEVLAIPFRIDNPRPIPIPRTPATGSPATASYSGSVGSAHGVTDAAGSPESEGHQRAAENSAGVMETALDAGTIRPRTGTAASHVTGRAAEQVALLASGAAGAALIGRGSRFGPASPKPDMSGVRESGNSTNAAVGNGSADISASEKQPAARPSTAAQREALAPGLGMAPRGAADRRPTRRRGNSIVVPDRHVVPDLIVPTDDGPVVHDPGPGVIGLSR